MIPETLNNIVLKVIKEDKAGQVMQKVTIEFNIKCAVINNEFIDGFIDIALKDRSSKGEK